MRKIKQLLAVLLFFTSLAATAQRVKGKVYDAITGLPLIGASVSVEGKIIGDVSDRDGNYDFRLDAGSYRLKVSFLGYQTELIPFRMGVADYKLDIPLKEATDLLGEVAIVGSRAGTDRSDVERPIPVDVLSSKELQATGQVELAQQVQFVSPSFNSAKNAINGIANYADPASLKGLAPDQMLVLIEGKRYHQFSAIQGNVTVGKGTVVTDLNSVPSLALDKIEILRDGAAAQYGSDAIAGIVNLNLKKSVGTGAAQVQYGATSRGDGAGYTYGLNYGFKLTGNGFLNLTGNYQTVDATDRSDPYNPQPITGGAYTGIYTNVKATDEAALRSRAYWGGGTYGSFHPTSYGTNSMKSGQLFYNAGYNLNKSWSLYSFGGYSNKYILASAFLRTANPAAATSNPDIHPDGFVPELPGQSTDYSSFVGIRKKSFTGWNIDFSTGYGKNYLDQWANKTANASMGADSPKDFYVGRVIFGQSLTELNLTKSLFGFAGTKTLNLAFGSQYRSDNFQLIAGDEAASKVGPLAATKNKTPGSQGRVGIAKDDETNVSRSNVGIYADIESDITNSFMVTGAVRYENYSDFGKNISGKLASRLKITPIFSIRGSVNKGFRAPLLQQIANAATTSTVQAGVIRSTKQYPSSEQRLKQIGIEDPKPETSWNYNAGFTLKPGNNLLVTIDAYQIDIKDRIIITENLVVANILALKNLFPGIQELTFFTNQINTTTKGIDVVTSYEQPLGPKSRFTSTLALTVNKTQITNVKETPSLLQAGTTRPVVLIDTVSRALIETSQPHQKIVLSLGYRLGKLSLNLRGTHFGEVTAWEKPGNANHRKQIFGAKNLLDASLVFNMNKYLTLTVGGNNLTDVYPDKIFTNYASYSNGQVPYTRNANQFGFTGSYYYTNLIFSF